MSFFKKLKKAFKKFAKSTVGKVVLGAALVAVGGAALGAWKLPGALGKVNGILRAGGAAAKGGTVAGATASGATAGASAIPAGIETITVTGKAAGGLASAAPAAAGSALMLATAPTGAPATQEFSPVGEAPAPTKGFISKLMDSKAVQFVDNHPMASAMMLQGAAGAMSPDQIDVMREQQRLQLQSEEEDRKRRANNLNVAGINVGPAPISGQLRYVSTGQPIFQGGLLRRAGGV